MRTILALTLMAAVPGVVGAQATREDLKKLAGAGMSEEVILSYIKSNGFRERLTTDDLVELKEAGLSDKVLAALLEAGSDTSEPSEGEEETSDSITKVYYDYYYYPTSSYYPWSTWYDPYPYYDWCGIRFGLSFHWGWHDHHFRHHHHHRGGYWGRVCEPLNSSAVVSSRSSRSYGTLSRRRTASPSSSTLIRPAASARPAGSSRLSATHGRSVAPRAPSSSFGRVTSPSQRGSSLRSFGRVSAPSRSNGSTFRSSGSGRSGLSAGSSRSSGFRSSGSSSRSSGSRGSGFSRSPGGSGSSGSGSRGRGRR